MKNIVNVLMVDDHPMIIEGYKNTLLENAKDSIECVIDIAFNCQEGLDFIQKNLGKKKYDLALIDIKLPPSNDGSITSGEDLAVVFKNNYPEAKVIISTMHNEDSRIHNILQTVNPEGFLIKSDLSSTELVRAFEEIMEGKSYYSTTVTNHFRKMMNNNFSLDKVNLQILYHLSRGVQTKNLGNYINLSLSAIEKRKNHIKELFDIKSSNDEKVIEEARKRGFI